MTKVWRYFQFSQPLEVGVENVREVLGGLLLLYLMGEILGWY